MTYVGTYLIRGLLRCRPTKGRNNVNTLCLVLFKKGGKLKSARFLSQEFLSSKMDVLCFDLRLYPKVDADKKEGLLCKSVLMCL